MSSALIHEEFVSYQGTGHLLGLRQYFVRFAGCSVVDCPIRRVCDEPQAILRARGLPSRPRAIVERALDAVGSGGWIHLTGGEPTDQAEALAEVARLAQANGLRVHLQTSGVRPIEFQFDWLTVSPKTSAADLAQRYGHELVVIYDSQTADELREYEALRFFYYYLAPQDRRRDGLLLPRRALLDSLADRDRQRHHNAGEWLLTTQAHKSWGIA